MSQTVSAVQDIRALRSGAQSHLILGDDQHVYVVKCRNNPQQRRILANELLATKLSRAIGLRVPACSPIMVSDWLMRDSRQMEPRRESWEARLQFASRFVGGRFPEGVVDYITEPLLADTKNIHEFGGMLAFDKWTGNLDARQAVFHKTPQQRAYRAIFIDQGECFSGVDWKFIDSPLDGVYARNIVYRHVTGWESFEPWLSRIEQFDALKLWVIGQNVPPEWYAGDEVALVQLIEQLLDRRSKVRELIGTFRHSSRRPFPN